VSIAEHFYKNYVSKQLAAAIVAFLLSSQVVSGAAIRIMPLGDSITAGSNSGVIPDDPGYYLSYRKALKDKLVAAGYVTDFVGSQIGGNLTGFADPQHEGHPGWLADGDPSISILPRVNAFLSANPAEIVLLHIGTNDIGNEGQAPLGVKNEIEKILDAIDDYERSSGKDVWVVLALIVNRGIGCSYRSETTSLNNALEAMAVARQTGGDKIVVVDMEAAIDNYNVGGDLYDCVHPSALGYSKMADAWLLGLLDIPPQADAGSDQNVNPGVTVNLNGAGSLGSFGTIAAYAWAQTAGSPTVVLKNASTDVASFTAPEVGSGGADLTFKLTVTDTNGNKGEDTCIVQLNGPPVADAGLDQQVNAGATVLLDGTRSFDADGAISTYAWLQTSGPAVVLAGSTSAKASFIAPAAAISSATLTFQLAVTDSLGRQSTDSTSVAVAPDGGQSQSGGGGGGGGCFITAAGN
jgi:lysophospholipase L1-like esterase